MNYSLIHTINTITDNFSLLRLVDGKIVEVELPIEAETPTEATT